MSDFNALKFVADNAGLNIFKALEKAYEQGKADANYPEFPDSCNAETVEAIPVPWIESYALLAEADGRPFFAEGIRDMVEEWKRDRKVD